MDDLTKFNWNEERVEEIYIQERLKQYDDPYRPTVFWDMDELCRRTGLDAHEVKVKFFTDELFIRFKVGSKWLFPADDTKKFLMQRQEEQNNKGGL